MPEEEEISHAPTDSELELARSEILGLKNFAQKAAGIVRLAIDNVLQGDRTKRYSIEQLTPEEKKHIGTQIEKGLKKELFEDRRGEVLDTTIAGIEVDIKNTIGDNWMIPPEAVGKLCLLNQISERSKTFSVGLVRASHGLLNSENQDKKRSISRRGKETICWLIQNAPLPVSTFLTSEASVVDSVFAKRSGQARVAELFRQIQKLPIERSDIAAVAAGDDRQIDLRARVRDARIKLASEGLLVFRGWNRTEREEALKRGYAIDRKQCITIPNTSK
jgi:restriction endonuclease NaeI